MLELSAFTPLDYTNDFTKNTILLLILPSFCPFSSKFCPCQFVFVCLFVFCFVLFFLILAKYHAGKTNKWIPSKTGFRQMDGCSNRQAWMHRTFPAKSWGPKNQLASFDSGNTFWENGQVCSGRKIIFWDAVRIVFLF